MPENGRTLGSSLEVVLSYNLYTPTSFLPPSPPPPPAPNNTNVPNSNMWYFSEYSCQINFDAKSGGLEWERLVL